MHVISDFLAGDKDEIFTSVSWQIHTIRIDEVIVFTEYKEIVSAIQVPERYGIRMRIGMSANDGMRMGIAFVPSFNFWQLSWLTTEYRER
jgi:hypothetical protein